LTIAACLWEIVRALQHTPQANGAEHETDRTEVNS